MATAETYFFLALKLQRLPSLKNEALTDHYCQKLQDEKLFETLSGSQIVLNVVGLKSFLAKERKDKNDFERSFHKFRAFMNEADDVLFRRRRFNLPSQRAIELYSLNPRTFKRQNVDN